jgi:hypothetical protein
MNKFALPVAVLIFVTTDASSQTSSQNALMGLKAWSAFECSALASYAKDEKESERLFTLGYESGKVFLTALRAGKIQPDDIQARVPVGVMWKVAGPNIDFVLGRIWESASENVLKEVFEVKDDEGRVLAAQTGYNNADSSCTVPGASTRIRLAGFMLR